MQSTTNYFTGFTGSRNFESPFIRAIVANSSPGCQAVFSTVALEFCDTITSSTGRVFTSPGIYRDTLRSVNGCDSVIIYDVQQRLADTTFLSPGVCGAYEVPSGDTTLYTSTRYIDTLKNLKGCDSLLFINLTVNPNLAVVRNGDTLVASETGANYQWLDCNNGYQSISGANARSYTLTAKGSYAVEIVKNSCTDTSECFVVNSIGSLQNKFQHQITAYPNPSDGIVQINLGKSHGEITAQLRNAEGKLLSTEVHKGISEWKMQLPEVSGIYVLILRTDSGEQAQLRLMRR